MVIIVVVVVVVFVRVLLSLLLFSLFLLFYVVCVCVKDLTQRTAWYCVYKYKEMMTLKDMCCGVWTLILFFFGTFLYDFSDVISRIS